MSVINFAGQRFHSKSGVTKSARRKMTGGAAGVSRTGVLALEDVRRAVVVQIREGFRDDADAAGRFLESVDWFWFSHSDSQPNPAMIVYLWPNISRRNAMVSGLAVRRGRP